MSDAIIGTLGLQDGFQVKGPISVTKVQKEVSEWITKQPLLKILLMYHSNSKAKKLTEVDSRVFKHVEGFLSECNMFVVHQDLQSSDKTLDYIREAAEDQMLDLPFKSCMFELAGTNFDAREDADGHHTIMMSKGLVVREIAPKKYEMFQLYVHVSQDGGMAVDIGSWENNSLRVLNKGDKFSIEELIFMEILRKINSMEVGYEKINERFKDRTGELHKIKRMIHIAPKRIVNNMSETLTGKHVIWDKQWEVRGHWRTFWMDKESKVVDMGKVGKNRDDEYTVNGYTWVREHTAGNAAAPLVKKVRHVLTEGITTSDS